MFSNKEAREIILLPPYEEILKRFGKAFAALLQIAPTPASVNDLPGEEEEMKFIQAFRELIRVKNTFITTGKR